VRVAHKVLEFQRVDDPLLSNRADGSGALSFARHLCEQPTSMLAFELLLLAFHLLWRKLPHLATAEK